MKGVTHFATGVAFASFWPQAVRAGAEGNPLYFLLGGACGLLPDTLDFKLARYFHRHDIEIVPDPARPDPRLIADTFARAIHQVRASGKPLRIKLHTVRVGAGLWGQYRLTFDEARHGVTAAYTGVVTTGREPVAARDIPQVDRAVPARSDAAGTAASTSSEAFAPLACSVCTDYEATVEIDIFEGPSFTLERLPDSRVCVRFIPWHRQWSHSLTFAAGLGLLAGWLGGVVAGAIAAGACALHTAADQLGFMGSNLFFPFTKQRTTGRQLLRSDNALVNFAVVWISILLIGWNLARQAPPPTVAPPLIPLLFLGGLLPLAAVWIVSNVLSRDKQHPHPPRSPAGRGSRASPACSVTASSPLGGED
jgi:membrane-bound metal-dependent hydrolase YbcI (DUF457 family)